MKFYEKLPDFLAYLKNIGLSEKTVNEHRRILYGSLSSSVIFEKEISDLKFDDVGIVAQAGSTHGRYGSQRVVMSFKKYLLYLQDSGISVPVNPFRIPLPKVKMKEKMVLTREQVIEILNTFPVNSPRVAVRKTAIVMRIASEVMIGTGMRVGECLSMKRSQFKEIKETNRTIVVAKGGDERAIMFTPRAVRMLEEYLNQRRDDCPMMFVNSYGEPLIYKRYQTYMYWFRRQFPPNIAKHLTSHIWRRTRATWLFVDGMDLKSMQHIFGWKSPRTPLKHYIKVDQSKSEEKFKQMTIDF